MSSRLFVFILPVVVIAIFWAMARRESKLAHDPTHKSFFKRNGTSLGIVYILLVAFWALFLVTLPYLYMVVESFHPKLPPAQRGGPTDVLTIAQYKSFFVNPIDNEVNGTHIYAFVFSILASVAVTALNFAICYPIAYYMAQAGTAQKVRLLMLGLIVPYWVNEILRAFALRLLLASKGLINQMLMGIHVISDPIPWLADPFWAKVVVISAITWRWTGYNMIFYLAAMQNIDRSIYEAARIDGVPASARFWKITVPMLKPVILFTSVISTIGTLQLFDEPNLLTAGGPSDSTLTLSLYIYNLSFKFMPSFGYAATVSYVIVVLVGLLSLVQFVLARDRRG